MRVPTTGSGPVHQAPFPNGPTAQVLSGSVKNRALSSVKGAHCVGTSSS